MPISYEDQYPLTTKIIGGLDQGEAHLRHLARLDQQWVRSVDRDGPLPDFPGSMPALPHADTIDFDIVYAGGTLSLPHALLMARRGYRVLVFDRNRVGFVRREWNVGRNELAELWRCGLMSEDEARALAHREYDRGLIQFHGAPPVFIDGVLDVPLDAAGLMFTLREAVEAVGAVRDGWSLKGWRAGSSRISVAIETPQGPVTVGARLLILATGASAARDFDLVCPTVGTVARGFASGTQHDEVDPQTGEILVTTEGVRHGRQLVWEGFPGRGDEFTTYLFYYHEPRPAYPGRLFELFERYFETLPRYKRGTAAEPEAGGVLHDGVEHLRPTYGFIPAYTRLRQRPVSPDDRVLAYGDAAAQHSPLAFTGFGSALRNLSRMVEQAHRLLVADALDQGHLDDVRAGRHNTDILGRLTLMMTPRPGRPLADDQAINDLLAAAFRTLSDDFAPDAAQRFLQDRFSWWEFHRFMVGTARRYPAVWGQVVDVLRPDELMTFATDYFRFAASTAAPRAS